MLDEIQREFVCLTLVQLIRFDKDAGTSTAAHILIEDVTRAGNDGAMILSGVEINVAYRRPSRRQCAGERVPAEMEYFLKSYSNHLKQKLRPFFSVRSEKFARKLPP